MLFFVMFQSNEDKSLSRLLYVNTIESAKLLGYQPNILSRNGQSQILDISNGLEQPCFKRYWVLMEAADTSHNT